ncbi:splicing factor, CC1-like protein [Lindgomyces ingoldianus]|uniref:Splicing factor, CC1-like protein n=1 Tax=Lindgomyces ingoldianus TaxID=673940 RepID=A0ACB6QH93_9PLEO|nr:splicing factor, CC1-like protein [Lindgomyces ingoldianus]KAF2466363.1 splicing factor, CC1-like protein [Lindgomyces ingoldianus]
MSDLNAVEMLLDNAAAAEEAQRASPSSHDSRTSHRRNGDDRSSERDRHRRDRDRDGDRDRGRIFRESDKERHRSRERRRRDGSRTRSNMDADTDEELPDRTRNGDDQHRRRERSRERRERDEKRRGDYYVGGGHHRSRSPRRNREDRRDSYRSGRDRSRSRERDTRRRDDNRRPRRRNSPATPPPTEDDRDRRTIFVQQISARAEVRHLRQFFERVGAVVEAQIVTDRVTGRSKGVGYVEFKEEESVKAAIELTGQTLKGVPIIAQLTEAEKNRASRASAEGAGTAGNGAPFHRLYVGNIHFSVTEEDLRTIFQPFGELEQVTLQTDEQTTRSKGYGFVQFRDPEAAKAALEQMNGFELAGRPIRVGLGSDKFTPESTANLLRNFNSQASTYQGSAFSGAGGRGAHAGGSGGVFDRAHGRDNRGVSGASALDDTDVGGVNFNNFNRVSLMHKLARIEEPEPVNGRSNVGVSTTSRAPVVEEKAPSKCVKIENMFNPDIELASYGANWAKELEKEVKEECQRAYGPVVHIAVDQNSQGDVYVKFETVSAGERAYQGLNGRLFNGNRVMASYVVDMVYNSMYRTASSRY